jgi:hypothetical protein
VRTSYAARIERGAAPGWRRGDRPAAMAGHTAPPPGCIGAEAERAMPPAGELARLLADERGATGAASLLAGGVALGVSTRVRWHQAATQLINEQPDAS